MSEERENTSQIPFVIDAGAQIGMLALAVADLDRSLVFYTELMGFEQVAPADLGVGEQPTTSPSDGAREATLGVGGVPLLHLIEVRDARPWPQGGRSYTGLYHFAILVPTQADLGRWLSHWLSLGLPMPGQGDHLVSEALYLSDPDGNGIEVYRDRPRAEWTWVGDRVRMATDPVDVRGLLSAAAHEEVPWQGLPAGTRIGHMHLQVGDIAHAREFYADLLGFEVTAEMPTALFISAGRYHHHIGMNTWHSRNASAAPPQTAGLRFFTIDLPSHAALSDVVARVRTAGVPVHEKNGRAMLADPWGNLLVLQVGAATDAAAVANLRAGAASTMGTSAE